MERNEILNRISELLEDRNWTLYRLAKEAGIPYSSISSNFKKNTYPTIPTLYKICFGLKISPAEFFTEKLFPKNIEDYLTKDEKLIIEVYRLSDSKKKNLIKEVVKSIN